MSLSVVIDARKVGDGGIGVYIENLVDGLLDLGLIDAGELDLHLLVTPEFEFGKGSSEVQACAERWRGKVQTVVEYAKKYSLSEYLQIGRRHRALFRKADVFHAPHYTLPLNIGCPTVVTVHDVIHVSHPETFYHRPVSAFLISSALQRATEVITVSHASAQVLKNLVRDPGKLIHVIPNAVRREIGQSTPREIEVLKRSRRIHRPYCMFVGNDRPHKGFRELVDAWMILKRRLRERGFQTPELFAVGNRFQPSTLRLVSSCGLADDIRFLGEVGTVELGHLYCGARAVIVPSRVEGFGLPALEGMASGVPVICTPVASLRELCANAAWYSYDLSGQALAATIYKALQEPEEARRRAKRGLERAAEFDRAFIARETFRVYMRACGRLKGKQESFESVEEDVPARMQA